MEKTEDFTKGIKPEYRQDYQEVIQEIAADIARNIGKDESDAFEQEEKPEHRGGVLSRLREMIGRKMTIFVLAGFLNLTGPIQESKADQVRMAWQKGEIPQFFLEESITEEKLLSFEEKLKREEPEFVGWVLEQEVVISRELDEMADSLFFLGKDQEEKQADIFKEMSRTVLSPSLQDEFFERKIIKNRKIMEALKSKREEIKEAIQFLKNNLHDIILMAVLLDDSEAVRSHMIRFGRPANIKFTPHHLINSLGAAASVVSLPEELWYSYAKKKGEGGNNSKLPEEWEPEIIFTPLAFWSDTSSRVEINRFVNAFVHEYAGHALHFVSEDKTIFTPPFSPMMSMIGEGVIHDRTFQIIQYLNRWDKNIKPTAGASNLYDVRMIYASILNAILASSRQKESIADWVSGVISDKELVDKLISALEDMRLDPSIAKDLADLNSINIGFEPEMSTKLTVDLLSKLKMGQVAVSPDFLKNIFTQNRRLLDGWQMMNINALAHYLDSESAVISK